MKKILSFTLSVIIMLSLVTVSASAADVAPVGADSGTHTTDEGYVYFVNEDGTATVCGVPEDESHVVIPNVVDGYTVTGLGAYHQRLTGGENTLSLTVPEGVLYLDGWVLTNFPKAETINLPSSLIEIKYQDFIDRTAYYKNPDNWDNGVMYIGTNLITINNDVPETLVVREDTTCVTETAVRFADIVIKEVVYPKHPVYGIRYLSINTLERVTVPAEMEVIPDYLFTGCQNLQDVTIEDGITAIGFAAFRDCSSLDNIQIPESVTYIGEDAFVNCESLERIYIPPTVTSIDEHAIGYKRISNWDSDNGGYYYNYKIDMDIVISGAVDSEVHKYAKENRLSFLKSSGAGETVIGTRDEACFGKIGDANIDREVNIKDATAIQKHLASLDELSANGVILAEADKDGSITIKDATAIQKYIAGLETDRHVGETTDIRLYVHVYGKMGDDWWYMDEPYGFYYYKDKKGDMVKSSVEGVYDTYRCVWSAYVPVEANYINFGTPEFITVYLPMPDQDGMVLVPSLRLGDYLFDGYWEELK